LSFTSTYTTKEQRKIQHRIWELKQYVRKHQLKWKAGMIEIDMLVLNLKEQGIKYGGIRYEKMEKCRK